MESSTVHSSFIPACHLHAVDEPLPDVSVIRSVWNELMANPRHTLFGGYSDGELVSSCTLTVIPNLTRGCRPYGILENVVTHSAHRGKGYGRAVLREALASAGRLVVIRSCCLREERIERPYSFMSQRALTGRKSLHSSRSQGAEPQRPAARHQHVWMPSFFSERMAVSTTAG
jgi:GNAT superfamily N-acetyltransferase